MNTLLFFDDINVTEFSDMNFIGFFSHVYYMYACRDIATEKPKS